MAVHSRLRYRVNVPVPGMSRRTVDVSFSRAKVAVFMDGCFRHGCPDHATEAKANAEGWRAVREHETASDVAATIIATVLREPG
nr:hypothetical protein [Streptomyces lydicus]